MAAKAAATTRPASRLAAAAAALAVLVLLAAASAPSPASAWIPRIASGPLKAAAGGVGAAAGAAAAAATATAGAATATGLAIYLRQRSEDVFKPTPGSLKGQTAVITGASSGLGLESAKRLALGGARVVLTARTDDKGLRAVREVREYLGRENPSSPAPATSDDGLVSYKILDLDDLESVRESVANNWDDVEEITCLLNNAGIMALPRRETTVDGLERQIQSNHLGHFLLTALLAPRLSKDARIVAVSSEAHKIANKGLDFDYVWKAETRYGAWKSYGQSKLANILFVRELQRRVDLSRENKGGGGGGGGGGVDWTCVSLHPGVVGTDLGRYIFGNGAREEGGGGLAATALSGAANLFLKTPEQGATTQVWLAARADLRPSRRSGQVVDVRGRYLSNCKVRDLDDFAKSREQAERLWRESEELAGVEFDVDKIAAAAAAGGGDAGVEVEDRGEEEARTAAAAQQISSRR